jgi:hypothetical protein
MTVYLVCHEDGFTKTPTGSVTALEASGESDTGRLTLQSIQLAGIACATTSGRATFHDVCSSEIASYSEVS